MFNINYYKNYRVTSPFADDRSQMYSIYGLKDGKHEGIDFVGDHNLFNLFDGVISSICTIGDDPKHFPYGKFVKIYSNPKFAGGVDDIFYSQYCHLDSVDNSLVKGYFIKEGSKIGVMGNTGHSFGTHLHFMTYQDQIPVGFKTKLLNDILVKLNLQLKNDIAFWQFGKLFYNPNTIMDYLTKLQSGK